MLKTLCKKLIKIINKAPAKAVQIVELSQGLYKELSDFARKEAITFSEIEFIDKYLADRYPQYCWGKNQK